ncbi:hypothetical protein TIFTF001_055798, partial [Ficus carica]
MRSLLVSSASHSARSALRTKVSFDSSSVPFVSCSSCLCFLRDLLWSISQSSCSLHGQGPHELAYLSLALVPFRLSVDWKALPLHNQPPLAVHSCYEALAVNERRYEENHEPLRNTLGNTTTLISGLRLERTREFLALISGVTTLLFPN